MAKIAVAVEQALARRAVHGTPGGITAHLLAQGDGWAVHDMVCTAGPQDRAFEERHTEVSIAVVAAGNFQYRSARGRELMTPGSVLLGSEGQCFECGHEHGAGDRCLSFHYSLESFERLAADTGRRGAWRGFGVLRLPPLKLLAPLVARAFAGLAGAEGIAWEELSVELAAQAVQLAAGLSPGVGSVPPGAEARVARTVRTIERQPDSELTLSSLAGEAELSPFHFLRTFERLTGVTPHQYVLRTRLREAAIRLAAEPANILDVALDSGFADLSNFNRAFRAEFGVNPRGYRLRSRATAR